VQISDAVETLAVIGQAFGEGSVSCTRVLEWRAQGRPIKARQLNRKAKSMLIIFFEINGIVHKDKI
jgi:hypothetical protein